uniref:Uncharacterized protein n=1 Tax=Oryza barthii TaxID=65489 RepID=A0A0D3FJD2_9ORYZ
MEWQQRPESRSEGVGPERRWSAVARDGGGGGTPAIWGGRAAACDSVEGDCRRRASTVAVAEAPAVTEPSPLTAAVAIAESSPSRSLQQKQDLSGDRQQRPESRSEGVGPERRWSAVARDGGGGGTPAIWGGRAAACDSVEGFDRPTILSGR